MKQDLDSLKAEIPGDIEQHGLVVFHGFTRLTEDAHFVYWDVDRYPDPNLFLSVAQKLSLKMVVYHHREFTTEYLDDATNRLNDADLPREDRRDYEQRLRQLRVYEGFTCSIELSFDYEGKVYLYALRTDWYDELLEVLDELDASMLDVGEEDDEDPMGGYFSRN